MLLFIVMFDFVFDARCSIAHVIVIDRSREELSTYGRYFLESHQDYQLTSRKWLNVAQQCTGEDVVDIPSMNDVWKALHL